MSGQVLLRKGDLMDTNEDRKRKSAFGNLGKNIGKSIKKDGLSVGNFNVWINVGAVVVGFLFGGCHLVFGAYPLGVALVSALPSSVWPALIGAVLGSLTLGSGGMIYAMICVLGVFLRIIISGGTSEENSAGDELFSESVSLRVCAAVISGFVAAVYEALLGGIRASGIIFGVAMIVLSAAFTFVFSGVFYHGIGVRALVFGTRRIFESRRSDAENRRILVFKISSVVFLALLSLSLQRYDFFGINLSFVFAGCITLFTAKRFGAFYGGAVGFFSSVAVSGIFSPAYSLLGLLAGALFPYGVRYAATAGGAILSLWGAYVSGVSGFLALFPEYLVALCVIVPMLSKFERENNDSESATLEERLTDMVGTMALAYRNRQQLACERLEKSLTELLPVVSSFLSSESTTEDFAGFLKLVGDGKDYLLEKRELDTELSDKLDGVLEKLGIRGGIIRAFGERRKYIICAAEDRDGTLISSPELKSEIESASSLVLGTPKYYRRRDIAIMESEAAEKYKIKASYLTERGIEGEISGDSVGFFESDELYAYGVISDGMGSGSAAKRTSEFALRFLKAASSYGASRVTAVHMINSIIRRQKEECSASLDMFCFDKVTGDAEFIKSGAAASYIKRNGSLYRIKSETMPLGLMKRVDAERVKASVEAGDVVIMISDGVCEPSDDAPWLVEVLNEACDDDLRNLGSRIIASARMNNRKRDDMSVLVMRIDMK